MGAFDYFKDVVFNNYANFNGRARRSEYWYFTLFSTLLYMVAVGLSMALGGEENPFISFAIVGVVAVALFLPSLAVMIRRLHDTNRSGWWILINFIPYLGGIVLLVFMCLDGTAGPNKYGEDPKGRGSDGTIVSNFG